MHAPWLTNECGYTVDPIAAAWQEVAGRWRTRKVAKPDPQCACPMLGRKELQAAQAGAEKKRRQRLKTVPVVGATCCATLLPVLDNMVRWSL